MNQSCLSTLPIGSVVQVSAENNSVKYMSHLIGVDTDSLLITKAPTTKQLGRENIDYEKVFAPTRTFIMRILGSGLVFGFKTQIVAPPPSGPHLLLSSYPSDIQTRSLRKESRYPCTLAANMRSGDKEQNGMVTNISANGCQLCVPSTAKSDELESIKEKQEFISVKIHFPCSDEISEIKAAVKSICAQDGDSIALGLAFDGEARGVKLFLESLHLDSINNFFQ